MTWLLHLHPQRAGGTMKSMKLRHFCEGRYSLVVAFLLQLNQRVSTGQGQALKDRECLSMRNGSSLSLFN